MHSQNGYKQKTSLPPPEHSAAFEIETQYRNLAEMLFAAILREPHNFALYAAKMHPIWWHDTQYDKAAQTVFGQAGNYSVRSVCIAAGIETSAEKVQAGALHESVLYRLLNEHADTDLPLALEMFEPVYRQWIEYRCAQIVTSGLLQQFEAERIREEQERFRRDRCAYVARGEDDNEAFSKWIEAKLEGLEINYPCKPALRSMIRQRFKIAWEPEDYVIVGARSSMGKTHFIVGEIIHFMRQGLRGIFISADMGPNKIKKRMLGQMADISPKGDWGALMPAEIETIRKAKEEIEKSPVMIIGGVVQLNEIVSICHAENFKDKIHYLLIDYLQLVQAGNGGNKGENRDQELGRINAAFKLLAQQLQIPIIALSQFSRAVDSRAGNRPQISDFRDSGTIEQAATTLMALFRPEYYGVIEDENGQNLKGIGEIIFLKQQEDETGTLKCKFDGVRGWSDLEEDFRFPNSESGQDFTVPISARPGMEDETDTIPF